MTLDLGRLFLAEDAPVVTVGGSAGAKVLHPRVLAILLIRSPEHLPGVLAGLRAQRRAPDTVIAVDCTGTGQIAQLLGPGIRYLRAAPGTTLDHAVRLALGADARAEDDQGTATCAEECRPTFLWLLDDADRPTMKTLAHQVRRLDGSDEIAAVGAKHRGGDNGAVLLDVGIAPGPLGARLTMAEPGERDQGQRDHLEEVYAAPLSGLLVRRDAWEQVGGLDGVLQHHPAGADLDLGRRLRLAGYRVQVAPDAVFTSPPGVVPTEPARSRAHRRLSWAPLAFLPLVALGLLLGGVGALLAGLAGKRPRAGLAALTGTLTALLRVDQVARARTAARRTRVLPRRRLARLRVPAQVAARWHRDRLLAALPIPQPPGGDGGPRHWKLLTALLTGFAAASLAGLFRLLGPGSLSSATTPDLPDSVPTTLRAAFDTWVPTGLGAAGPPDAFLAVLAVLGAGTGSPRLSAVALTLTALPLAALSAWWSAGGLTRRPRVRVLAGLLWAGSPVLLLSVAGGRFGLVVAALCLPVVARLVGQASSAASARTGWAWAGAAALVLVPAALGVPAFGLVAVPVCALLALRGRRISPLLVPLPSLVLLAPTLWTWAGTVRASGTLVLPQPMDPVVTATAPPWAAVLGWPVAAAGLLPAGVSDALAGVPGPSWALPAAQVLLWGLGAAPLLLALGVLGRCGRRGGAAVALRAGWLLAALGAVLVWAAGFVHVGYVAGRPVAADAYPGTLLLVLGLVVAAVSGLGARQGPATSRAARFGRGSARAAVAAVCLLPLLGTLGWAALQGAAPPATDLHRGAQHPLPALVVDQADSPRQTRTLLLAAQPQADPQAGLPALTLSLVRGDGPRVDRGSAFDELRDRGNDPAQRALREAVVRSLALDEDPRPVLAPFGIGALVLLPGDEADRAATGQLAGRLDARQGLARTGQVRGARVWRVEASEVAWSDREPAAVRLVSGDGGWQPVPSRNGRVDTTLTGGGRLMLAERADPGWRATLDGRPLERVDGGWQQTFEVPPGGGHLTVRHQSWWHPWWLGGAAAVLLFSGLLALPVRRAEEVA